jgi:hypothetical protein
VGDYTLQNDEWAGYWFSGSPTQAIHKAKQAFADSLGELWRADHLKTSTNG